MSSLRNEVIGMANSTISTIRSFCDGIYKTINELSDVKSSFNLIKLDIETHISEREIVTNSCTTIEKMNNNIDEAIGAADNAINQAISECNMYITTLENDYNATRPENEEVLALPRLDSSNNVININTPPSTNPVVNTIQTSNSGNTVNTNPSVNTSNSTLSTPTNNQVNNSRVNTSGNTSSVVTNNQVNDSNTNISNNNQSITTNNIYGAGNINTTEELYAYLDNVLKENLLGNVNSVDLPYWNDYIKKFLVNNQLDQYLETIVVKNKMVLCVTKTNQVIQFNDISSLYGLVGEIKKYFGLNN